MNTSALKPAADNGPAPTEERQRVLIVDDEREILEEMGELLESRGLSVQMAGSAVEAMKRLAADPELNTVVSDIRMPTVDGLEMIDLLQKDAALHDRPLRFIMVTGHATLNDAQRSIRANAVDFVPKPINIDQLLEAISRARAQISEARLRRRHREELATKIDTERRRRLELSAEVMTLQAKAEQIQKWGGAAAGFTAELARLADVLRRTVDSERHRTPTLIDRDLAPVFAEFLVRVAGHFGFDISGPRLDEGGDARHKRLPPPPTEDAVEALLLALKLRGAASLSVSADFGDAMSKLHLLPSAPAGKASADEIDLFMSEAAQLALLAAGISVARIGGAISIEDIDDTQQAIQIHLPNAADGR
mgnify:CR=1 FL=1